MNAFIVWLTMVLLVIVDSIGIYTIGFTTFVVIMGALGIANMLDRDAEKAKRITK